MEERLQKFIAKSGIASRRKAEELIVEGKVLVNGKRVTELGTKINPLRDRVKIDGELLEVEKPVYLLLHKPKGVITSASDPEGRPTVMDYIKDVSGRIYPVGRLDYGTEGLLLLTNDGDFANALMHPSHGVPKVYEVKAKGRIVDELLEQLATGIEIDWKMTAPASVLDYGFDGKTGLTTLEITIHEGRNRQVRRMMEAIGAPVHNLKRIRYGGLTLQGVKRGAYRFLSKGEVEDLLFLATKGKVKIRTANERTDEKRTSSREVRRREERSRRRKEGLPIGERPVRKKVGGQKPRRHK